MRSFVGNSGYPTVRLCKGNKYTSFMIHRLVAKAFVPNPESKPEVNHKDGNKTNNSADNLEWVTTKENKRHACDAGLFDNRGSKNGCAKLSEEQVIEIRRLYATKAYRQQDLGDRFGVSQTMIGGIVRRVCWKHVAG